ncbi:MAG: class II fumarate hydratase [Planctomycetota bacterium]|nr:class II fumarate hydratase [Planctomycetota bacterium]
MRTRTEKDSMGEMEVPADALYGAQTRRAMLNFPVSGWRLPATLISALGQLKRLAARANCDLGKLAAGVATWIEIAAGEVEDGKLSDHFPLDVFQTGSATSSNMNANEVIARRAAQLSGDEAKIHPNDHVNCGQSSNDVMPTALQVAAVKMLHRDLLPAAAVLTQTLTAKANLFAKFIKIGRTHLQDATPVTMGQVFGGYAAQAGEAANRLRQAAENLSSLPLGGTAVGTGVNTHPDFARRVIAALNNETGLNFREAANHFAAQAALPNVVSAMGEIKNFALVLHKIANDIRLLASGPRCGYGELQLPAVQPGSSIMPGKVNPVICESVMQTAAWVVGAECAVTFATATLSNFELCVAVPVVAYQMLESLRLLTNVVRVFDSQALDGLGCRVENCAATVEKSLAMCTGLAPLIGYDAAAEIAKTAFATGRAVREVAREKTALPPEVLATALDPKTMLAPSVELQV